MNNREKAEAIVDEQTLTFTGHEDHPETIVHDREKLVAAIEQALNERKSP